MKIDKAKLDELKAIHPSGLYEEAISFTDEENTLHEVEFIYRKPTVEDMESYTKSCQKNPVLANLNLMQALIVHPEAGTVIDQLREYSLAVRRFIDEAISPFSGPPLRGKAGRYKRCCPGAPVYQAVPG
jgi:hypothetical protein